MARIEWYENKKDGIRKALADDRMRTALDRATTVFSENKLKALQRLPFMPYWKKRCREVKAWSIDHLEGLITETRENIEALGGVFYLARDGNSFNEYITKVCLDHGASLVVKGKSLTTEETFLNQALIENGIEVVETDLGECIIQLRGEKPSHFIVPAVHIPREEVAKTFSRVLKKELPPDIPTLTKVARQMLREKFINADVGITGANVVSADTSTIFLITNEGNGRFCSNAPPVHICATGIEKLVPTVEDAMAIVRILPPYATGQIMPSYVSLITGPSRTSDIELTSTIGVHGPKELFLVLLDNGRWNMIKDPDFKPAAYCIRCGACLNDCPVYREIGGQVFGYRYVGGIGMILTAFYHGLEKAAPFTFACTGCGMCQRVCPLELPIPEMIEKLRSRLVGAGFIPTTHAEIAGWIKEYQNPFGEPIERRVVWSKE